MTDIAALDRLIEAVEGGEWESRSIVISAMGPHAQTALSAFSGSLDAAKALHDALLPGWWFAIQPSGVTVGRMDQPHDGMIFDGASVITSRAWLLSQLRAYRAKIGGAA